MDEDNTNPNEEAVVQDQPQVQPEAPAPAVEEAVTEETPPAEVPEVAEAPQTEEPVAPPSRREQLRVEQLLRKYPNLSEQQAPSQSRPDFRSRVDADEEVYKTLDDTAGQFGADQYNAGLNQAQYTTWQRFLKMEEDGIRTKYDIFNPSKPDAYHPVAEKAMQEKYLRFVGYSPGDPNRGLGPSVQNPDISYSDFVEAEMEFSDELAAQRTARTTQNIARQAATTGLRPDGSSPRQLNLNKSAEDMTDEELNAAINATMPRDPKGRFAPHNK